MNSKIKKLFSFYISLNIISYLSYIGVNCEEKEEEPHINVPECPYKYVDGLPTCPNITSGGAIPKLMQCANKMKHDFMGFCKNPPSFELLDKLREECIEVCILPCMPMDMMSMVGDCDFDVSNLDLNMDMFCDKKKQKLGKVCAASLFRKHKNEYMDLFNKKIHMICQLCFNFYECYKRVKKELGIK